MNQNNPPKAEPIISDPVSPDALMSDFRGRPLIKIVIVTVIAHVLFIGAFSYGYIKKQVLGEDAVATAQDNSEASKQERMNLAKQESEAALRQIADRHGLSYRELSTGLTGSARSADAGASGSANPPPVDNPSADPGSDYQRDLEQQAPPPADPDLTNGIEDEDPIFPE